MTGLPHIAVRHHVATLIGCLVIAMLPGVIGSVFEPDAWYAALDKSALTPPGWVFPIVWSALYLSIGVALFVFLLHTDRRGPALAMFAVQLVLNGVWSWLFFGRHAPGAALIEIVLLWLSIAGTIALFSRASRLAAGLLVPYLAWVSFASYLTFAIWRAN